jgi:phage host-nuclease inhibitor protein Gam
MKKDPIQITTDMQREVRVLHDWADVDRAMLALRVAEVELASIGAKHDAVIQIAQEAKQAELQPIVSRTERMRERLEAFVEEHRADLEGRSLKLTHGTVGYRRGNPVVAYERDAAHSMDMLKVRGLDACIAVVEKIDKKAVRGLDETELAVCGISITHDDRFFVRLAKSPVVIYPEVERTDGADDA